MDACYETEKVFLTQGMEQNPKSAGSRRRLTIPLLLIFSAVNKRDKPVVLRQCQRRPPPPCPVHLPHIGARARGNDGENRTANRDYALGKRLLSKGWDQTFTGSVFLLLPKRYRVFC